MKGDVSSPVFDKHCGAVMRSLRKVMSVSLAALAPRIGVSWQQLRKYETGENRMPAYLFWKICKVLDVPPDFMMGRLMKRLDIVSSFEKIEEAERRARNQNAN